MSLEYAILGFLNYQPMSGYDLKKVFDVSVRHFWSADQSQIYRTLGRLTEQGLAEMTVFEQSDRPDRKVYHITPAGSKSLYDWLAGAFPTEGAPHSSPLVQVFFSGGLSDAQVLEKFKAAAGFFRMVLGMYEQVPGQIEMYEKLLGSKRDTYFWMLTLDLGMRTMRTQLEWAEDVVKAIECGEVPAADPDKQ
jgi:PadR family transcriptional regulator, regulatory protein AphA